MPKTTRKPKRRAIDKIKDRIIELVENSDELIWRQPWIALKDQHPRNAISGRHYSGFNFWMLGAIAVEHGYTDPRWLTYKQAQDVGGHVRKGEKGSLIAYYERMIKKVENEDGEEEDKPYFYMKVHSVFNVAQTEDCDLPALELAELAHDHDPIEAAEAVIHAMPDPPTIVRGTSDRAYYVPGEDLVVVPAIEQFITPEHYYKTNFHELAHSTGHESRLDRKMADNHALNMVGYGTEELIAEMTAAMLCGHVGIDTSRIEETSAAYIQGWMKRIKERPEILIKAASQSKKAMACILGEA